MPNQNVKSSSSVPIWHQAESIQEPWSYQSATSCGDPKTFRTPCIRKARPRVASDVCTLVQAQFLRPCPSGPTITQVLQSGRSVADSLESNKQARANYQGDPTLVNFFKRDRTFREP